MMPGNKAIESQIKSKNSRCIRLPFWLNAETDPIFCWLHLPKNKIISKTALVVCPPLGYEYSHAHRTIRHLCDSIAEKGKACIRFDYHGTGDSFSDLFDSERVNTFVDNIDKVIQFLRTKLNIEEIALLGIRLGATLAAVYSNKKYVDQLILWAPCEKGKSYVREMKALEKLASHSSTSYKAKLNFIDSGGFIVTNHTAKTLNEIDITKQQYLVHKNILIIERDDLPSHTDLVNKISSNTTAHVESVLMENYLGMMAEPQSTIIPQQLIAFIDQFLSKNNVNETLNAPSSIETLLTSTSSNNHEYTEKICFIPEKNIFGLLCYSDQKTMNRKPLVLIVNSGSVHHVGPNRIYTELSREISSIGLTSFRIDLSNLGDNVEGTPFNENHPYPSNAIRDIEKAIEYLEKSFGFNEFIIMGLCSGAHNTFHAGLKLPQSLNIKELILINPLTFYREPDGVFDLEEEFKYEKEKQQYRQSIFNFNKWKKFLSGNVDITNIISFLLTKINRGFAKIKKLITTSIGISNNTDLANDLVQISRDMALTFVIASKDPGEEILRSNAKSITKKLIKMGNIKLYRVENADHTFSSFNCRTRFKQILVKHLKSEYVEQK